jgi:hypothetical protein
MSMSNDSDSGDDATASGYQVGFRRPPIASRFKLGNPGNPTGRRKRRKTVGDTIEDALRRRVEIKENGRARKETMLHIIILNLVRNAAKGDARAIRTLFGLLDRYQDSVETAVNDADLAADDRKIIEEYLAKLKPADQAPASDADANAKDPPSDADDNSSENPSGEDEP